MRFDVVWPVCRMSTDEGTDSSSSSSRRHLLISSTAVPRHAAVLTKTFDDHCTRMQSCRPLVLLPFSFPSADERRASCYQPPANVTTSSQCRVAAISTSARWPMVLYKIGHCSRLRIDHLTNGQTLADRGLTSLDSYMIPPDRPGMLPTANIAGPTGAP